MLQVVPRKRGRHTKTKPELDIFSNTKFKIYLETNPLIFTVDLMSLLSVGIAKINKTKSQKVRIHNIRSYHRRLMKIHVNAGQNMKRYFQETFKYCRKITHYRRRRTD